MAGEITYHKYRVQNADIISGSRINNGGGGGFISGSYIQKTGDDATGSYTFDTDTLVIDATNHRIGIKQTSPAYTLDVSGIIRVNDGTPTLISTYKGTGADGYNIFIGTIPSSTSSSYCIGIGINALVALTTGHDNVAIGYNAFSSITTGQANTGIGRGALQGLISGSNNMALGYIAGRFIANGSTANTTGANSIFIGNNTQALADGDTNEIVIGYAMTGLGSNSVLIGTAATTKNVFYGGVGINTIEPKSILDVQYGFAKTDTTERTIVLLKSNELYANNPFALAFDVIGSASPENRSYIIQTTHYGIDTLGNLLLQPIGGKVGIGSLVIPRAFFDVVSGSANTDADIVSTASFTGPYQSGNSGILVVQSNDTQNVGIGGSIGFAGRYSNTSQATFSKIAGWKEDSTSGHYGGGMSFFTRIYGDNLVERMRIQPDGKIGIGTTAPQTALQVNGGISARSSTLADGYVYLNPGSSNYAGYILWWKPGSPPSSIGYMGYDAAHSGANLQLQLENSAHLYYGGGNFYFTGTETLGTSSFTSGFAGSGWQNSYGSDWTLTVDNLVVRKALTAYELDINKINSVNGGIIVSVANGTVMTVSGTTFYMDEDGTNKQIQFQVNDYVRAQVWTGRGVASYVGLVTAVNHSATYGSANIVCTTVSGTPFDKMELVQIGNTTDAARQNLIYITAADTNNPYIDMLAGVNDGSFSGKQKLRIGNLTGITDANFGGALSGYGLWANNVYLSGGIYATTGSIGGWTINSTYIAKDTGTDATSSGMAPADYPYYAGATYANRASAPFRITAAGNGFVGGFTIDSTEGLYSGTGTTRVQMKAGAGFWAGATAIGSAPFSVTAAGVLHAISGDIGGWTINSAYIAKDTGTAATSAGMAPADYPFYAGATYANRASAPFSVTAAGALHAISGDIGGWTINSTYIAKDTGTSSTSAGMAPSDYPFYAGATYSGRASAVFRVTNAGAAFMSNVTIQTGSSGSYLTLNSSTNDFYIQNTNSSNYMHLTYSSLYLQGSSGAYIATYSDRSLSIQDNTGIKCIIAANNTSNLFIEFDKLPDYHDLNENSEGYGNGFKNLFVHGTTGRVAKGIA